MVYSGDIITITYEPWFIQTIPCIYHRQSQSLEVYCFDKTLANYQNGRLPLTSTSGVNRPVYTYITYTRMYTYTHTLSKHTYAHNMPMCAHKSVHTCTYHSCTYTGRWNRSSVGVVYPGCRSAVVEHSHLLLSTYPWLKLSHEHNLSSQYSHLHKHLHTHTHTHITTLVKTEHQRKQCS